MYEACLELLELDIFELGEAFHGLADENVWKRPAPELLSAGELAGHIAYWEAVRLAGEGDDLEKCKIKSPLVDHTFRYYTTSLDKQPTEQHLAMTAKQVHAELLRVHEEAIANFKALNPEPDTKIPGWPTGFTYREFLKYLVFHIAYHTGQIYSVRHLLGEETPDN